MSCSLHAGNVLRIWHQCTAQSLVISRMLAHDLNEDRFVPVFGGDLRRHLIVHEESLNTWHVAGTADDSLESQRLGIACMKATLRTSLQSRENLKGMGLA